MTRLFVGSAAPDLANDEMLTLYLGDKGTRITPEQARWLSERLDQELALLDGGAVQSVDAVDAPEVSDDERDAREQHPPEEMGAPEYRVGEKIPDGASEEGYESDDEADDTPLDVECDVCGRGFDTEAGKNIHEGQVHDEQEQSSDVQALDELTAMQGIGERRVNLLAEAGFEDLTAIHDAPVGAIAIDGISESSATEISRFAAERLAESSESSEDDVESGSDDDGSGDVEQDESAGDGESVLDHERIATAMDSIGIDESVATGDVVHAVDVHNRPFQVASQLGIPRADADDLIERLDLQDALDSTDGLAQQCFDGEEAA